MRVSGQAMLRGAVDRVYAALNDPEVLVRTIPGCERLERVGPDAYRMTLTAGVASIKGTYVADVRLTDQEAPRAFVMRAAGSGAPGTVSADVRVTLSDPGDGTTLLAYDADAVVGGMIGGVGQRMLSGVAKKTAGEFFAAVDRALTGETVEVVPASTAALAPGEPAIFTRPGGPAPAGPPGGFVTGLLVGAAIALAGAVVGGLVARRRS
jgi:carbon monoxide dehydrogenase subunit G